MSSDDCIFCKIVNGDIPAVKVYEDDIILAFLDIGPISDGHTLLIPKQHCDSLHSCAPQLLSQLALRLPKVAKAVKAAVNSEGYNLLCNSGRAAGQLVNHLHFHIIPRNAADGVFNRWPSYKYPEGKAERIAARIKENL